MVFTTRHTSISQDTVMVPTPTTATIQLQDIRVLAEQSTVAPSGSQRVTVWVKVTVVVTVSVKALGLLKIRGTVTARVRVAKLPVVGTLFITLQDMGAERAQGISWPTVKVPVTNSPPTPVVTVIL